MSKDPNSFVMLEPAVSSPMHSFATGNQPAVLTTFAEEPVARGLVHLFPLISLVSTLETVIEDDEPVDEEDEKFKQVLQWIRENVIDSSRVESTLKFLINASPKKIISEAKEWISAKQPFVGFQLVEKNPELDLLTNFFLQASKTLKGCSRFMIQRVEHNPGTTFVTRTKIVGDWILRINILQGDVHADGKVPIQDLLVRDNFLPVVEGKRKVPIGSQFHVCPQVLVVGISSEVAGMTLPSGLKFMDAEDENKYELKSMLFEDRVIKVDSEHIQLLEAPRALLYQRISRIPHNNPPDLSIHSQDEERQRQYLAFRVLSAIPNVRKMILNGPKLNYQLSRRLYRTIEALKYEGWIPEDLYDHYIKEHQAFWDSDPEGAEASPLLKTLRVLDHAVGDVFLRLTEKVVQVESGKLLAQSTTWVPCLELGFDLSQLGKPSLGDDGKQQSTLTVESPPKVLAFTYRGPKSGDIEIPTELELPVGDRMVKYNFLALTWTTILKGEATRPLAIISDGPSTAQYCLAYPNMTMTIDVPKVWKQRRAELNEVLYYLPEESVQYTVDC